MKWADLKWPDFDDLSCATTVVIPLGSIEQHGHHLPVCTDTAQVTSIAETVERRLPREVILLPTLWLGSSHHHLGFPGTLSVRPSLYSSLLCELTRSILNAGFRRLFFLNGHGGNEVPAAQALTELAVTDPQAEKSLLAISSWWSVGKPDSKKLQLESSAISHACEYETSLMLLLRPEIVRLDLAVDAAPRPEDARLDGEKRIGLFRRFTAMTATGSLGTPTVASATKGRSIHDAVVEDIVLFLQEFANWQLPNDMRLGN